MSFDRRRRATTGGRGQWLTLGALVIVIAAVIFNLQWIWGLLFLMWSIPSLFTGATYLVQPIHRDENPGLFWTVVSLWLGLSLALIAYDLFELFD